MAASMIGTGILVTPGYTVSAVGSHAIGLWLWVLGGVLALCGSLVIAEMATAMPKVGGEYVYVDRAWGGRAAFVYGWATIVLGFAGPTAAVALNAAGFFQEALEPFRIAGVRHDLFAPLAASVAVALFTALHCLGQRESGQIQTVVTVFKYVSLIAFAAVGLWFGLRTGSLAPNLAAESEPAVRSWPLALAAATSMVYINYSYIGWNATTYIAGELRDPQRLLPRALLSACAAVAALYLAMALAFTGAFTPAELRAFEPKRLDVLASAAAERFWPSAYTKPAFSGFVALGLLATVSAFALSGSRVMVAMAEMGHFPAFAGRWHATRQTPTVAILLMGLASTALCWFKGVSDLLNALGVGLMALGLLFGSSVHLLRRRVDYRPTFRTPLYPLPMLLYLLACAFVVTMNLCDGGTRNNALWGLSIVVVGFPLYDLLRFVGAIQRKGDDQHAAEPR